MTNNEEQYFNALGVTLLIDKSNESTAAEIGKQIAALLINNAQLKIINTALGEASDYSEVQMSANLRQIESNEKLIAAYKKIVKYGIHN